jgi:head-tail adaptor
MNSGQYNRLITISTCTTSETSGDVTESWSTPASARASVEQIDGSRYLKDNELIDRAVFKIKLWDNSYSDNIRIVYGTLTLYPIRPLTRNPGTAMVNEVTILCAVKK